MTFLSAIFSLSCSGLFLKSPLTCPPLTPTDPVLQTPSTAHPSGQPSWKPLTILTSSSLPGSLDLTSPLCTFPDDPVARTAPLRGLPITLPGTKLDNSGPQKGGHIGKRPREAQASPFPGGKAPLVTWEQARQGGASWGLSTPHHLQLPPALKSGPSVGLPRPPSGTKALETHAPARGDSVSPCMQLFSML